MRAGSQENFSRALFLSKRVYLQVFFGNLIAGHEAVVGFLDHFDGTVFEGEFKEGDQVAFHELGGDGAADQAREFFCAANNVLTDLHTGEFAVSALGLNGNDELASGAIYADIDFVDLDLADGADGGAQVALQRVW